MDFAQFERIGVGREKLMPFVTSPLKELEGWVQVVGRSANGLGPVSGEMPFNLQDCASSQTHCSEKTMQRLRSDVKKFADGVNIKGVTVLKGFGKADISRYDFRRERSERSHAH